MMITGRSLGHRGALGKQREAWLFLALVLPNFALFALFTYYPFLYNLRLSFSRWDMLAPVKTWVGLANYRELFTSPAFGKVMSNTLIFVFATLFLTLLLGLIMALVLNQPLKGRNLARAVVFGPVMLSGAAIGMVWVYIFDPRYGLVDYFLQPLGLRSPNWLLDTNWALAGVIIVQVWKTVGYAVVIYLAGLKAISASLYEAAVVDGANAWQRFRHITLPGLSPVTFFLTLTTLLSSFQSFDVIKVMTDGGPVDATMTLIYYLYQEGFVGFSAGRAGVAAVVLFALMLSITLFQMRYGERGVNYA